MEKVRVQDNLYDYVNGEWLEKAVIPDDRPTTGGFADLDQGVEKLLMADFKKFADGKEKCDIEGMEDAIKLYRKILDVNRRNKEGIKPLLPLLEKIKALKTPEDLNKIACDLSFLGVDLPINMGVTDDMKDATKHCFVVLGPSIILPDTAYYDPANPAGKQLLGIYEMMARKALEFTPLSKEEQDEFMKDTLEFDSLVAKQVKSQLEWADYVKNYNPMSVEDVQKFVAPLDLMGMLKQIYGDKSPKTIIVYDPKAIKECKQYFNAENFKLYVHWAYVKTLLDKTQTLSEELYAIGTTYMRALTGVAKDPVLEKQAYRVVSQIYSEPIGVYYGRKYFGEEAKKDIISIVKKIIETYKLRMHKNSFLAEETKEKAVLKLSTIEIKMGYPDFVRDFFKTLKVNDEDSYFDAISKIMVLRVKHEIEKLNKPVDRSEWLMPGHMVNACYNPSANDITFPAAILQKPFYSIKQSVSENLGGIGAVIGHEISHAFDNNGAQFDENGNLNNWWKEGDYAAFKNLTKDMIEQFDGIPFHGGKVNGELVVSENIADNGGMGVTLEIMHTLPNPDFQAYFLNWGRIWCRKAKEEYIALLLNNDVHSPAELRANMQPRNFEEWYKAFDVKETDQMFIKADKRITIW